MVSMDLMICMPRVISMWLLPLAGGGGSRCHSQSVGVRCSRLVAEEGSGWGAFAEQRLERGDALVCASIMCLSVPII